MRKTIAVTGATGHVGANLIRLLADKGFKVKVLVRSSSEALKGVPVDILDGDLFDKAALEKLCQQADVVIHVAALISIGGTSEKALYDVNVTGTQNIIQACERTGVPRLIHFSSVDAFQMNGFDEKVDENTLLDLNSKVPYKKTKALAEEMVMEAAGSQLEVVVLSPAAILGPNDNKPSLTGQMMMQMYQGRLPVIVPGGYHWVDVRDVCDVAVKAIDSGSSGQKYILAGEWVSLAQLASIIQQLSPHKVLRAVIPFWMGYAGIPFTTLYSAITQTRPLYTRDSLDILRTGSGFMSWDKAKADFGFNPRPITDTVADAIKWYKNQNWIR